MRTTASSKHHWARLRAWACLPIGLVTAWSPLPSWSAESSVPWECSGYQGEAQARCVQTFIEQPRTRIAELEGERQAQARELDRLRDQVDRQHATTAEMQQELADQTPSVVPVPVPYGSWYPPVGFSLYLGRPWVYGPYGPGLVVRPYGWGPRYYGPHGRWARRR